MKQFFIFFDSDQWKIKKNLLWIYFLTQLKNLLDAYASLICRKPVHRTYLKVDYQPAYLSRSQSYLQRYFNRTTFSLLRLPTMFLYQTKEIVLCYNFPTMLFNNEYW